jgi:hypothetical protein
MVMTRKKRKKKPQIAIFAFTLETIKLTEEAIKLFDQPLQQADHRDTKVVFAEETMQQVKDKLNTMKQSVGLMCVTSFDYNEKIMLIQALRAYSLLLSSLPANDRQAREIRQCKRIAAYFEAENARAAPERRDNE